MHPNQMSELKGVLPTPEKPLDCDEAILVRNQRILKIKFPADFVEFGRTYGSGEIKTAYSWEVWSPFRSTYPLIVMNFARIVHSFRDAMQITAPPFGVFPEAGGVLPFASTPNGDWVCWETKGKPDEWSVIDLGLYEKDGYQRFDLGFSGYFASVLTRKIILDRHEGGDKWDPQKDVSFVQEVYADQNY
jgi:hypothetical protein